VVKTRPGLGDGSGVGKHADRTLDLGKVTAGDGGRGLVVDADLEASGAPVDKLDSAAGLDLGDRGVDVLGDDVTAVEEAAGHVLAVAGVALDHLVVGLEAGRGDLGGGQLLVRGLLRGDDGRIGDQGEVDAGVRHQVGLLHENGYINISFLKRKLTWNSLRSTFRAPSKRSEAVIEETHWLMRRLRLMNEGRSMSRLRRQMS